MHNYEQTNNLAQHPHTEMTTDPVLPPSPNNPPWNSGVAFLAWVGSVIFLILPSNIAVLIYISQLHMDLSNADKLKVFVTTDSTAILLQLFSVIPAHILTIIMAWLIITRLNKYSFTEMIGWKWGGVNIFYIIGIVVGFYALAIVLGYFFGDQEHDLTRMLKNSPNAVYVVAFMATFTAPLVEETIYRGILYSAFQRTFGVALAVVAVTALFAGVHFIQYWNSPVALLMVTLLSLVLTLIRVKSDNLLPCIVLHTVFNGVQSLLLVLEPLVNKGNATNSDPASILLHLIK